MSHNKYTDGVTAMLYSFKIEDTKTNTEAGQAYFETITAAAQRAVASQNVCDEQAFSGCEYIDLVDSGSITMDRALYRQCVALVSEYLQLATHKAARALAARSWAANTLVEVMAEVWKKQSNVRYLTLPQQAA